MRNLETYICSSLPKSPAKQYFVASSGGVDSMVLLYVLHKNGYVVSALHVNYQLRGLDSENDQKLIETTCERYGIPFHIKRTDLHKQLEEKGGNLQEEARNERYAFFENFTKTADSKIVFGHHADDQVETFFLNLARDAGIMGLAGMLEENECYLRPLLPFSKAEIHAYAKENGIVWREDISNESNKYQRNKLRNIFLPTVKEVIPDVSESVLLLMRVFQESQLELERIVTPIYREIVKNSTLSLKDFNLLSKEEILELLRQLGIPLRMFSEVLKIQHSEKGHRLNLSNNLYSCIIREVDYFYFQRSNTNVQQPILNIEKVDFLPNKFTKDVLFVNPIAVEGELKLRKWEIGDRMRPIGAGGSKLISDILSDAKVPNHLREDQFVVHDDRQIFWCVGFAIGGFRPTEKELILKITLHFEG
jgi:tRNA(Ile)-lysidine synthase